MFLFNYIFIYFQYETLSYKGYGPNEYKKKERHLFMHPKDPYYSNTRQNEKVAIIMALPIMLVCSLCAKLKKYIRVNHSTFMIHFQEYHQDVLDDTKVARCPICWMWFNNIRTAKTHLENNHKNILSRKTIEEHKKEIEQTADPTKAIDYKNKL